jgi:hypothetical protein
MRTRAKDLGTALETRTVRAAQDAGLVAERIAEGGANDRGDVRIYTDVEWVGECKDRMSLNLPQAVEKALLKSGTINTFVVWRKMRRPTGSQRRVQDGPVVVAMTLDVFLDLLKGD